MKRDMKSKRPTSPHLTIYKPQLTSMLSIFHRITGLALYGSLFIWALFILSYSPQPSTNLSITLFDFFSYFPGFLLFAAWLFCAYFHLLGILRHLIWSVGRGFEPKTVTTTALLLVATSCLLTGTTLHWFKTLEVKALESPL